MKIKVMLPNECEKMSDEWWVMNDENWVTEIEWPFFVGQTGSYIHCSNLHSPNYIELLKKKKNPFIWVYLNK